MIVVARKGSVCCVDDGEDWIMYNKREGQVTDRIPKSEQPHYDAALRSKWGFREKNYSISSLEDLNTIE